MGLYKKGRRIVESFLARGLRRNAAETANMFRVESHKYEEEGMLPEAGKLRAEAHLIIEVAKLAQVIRYPASLEK